MAGYSGFSFTSLWARIGRPVDQALQAGGIAPRGLVVALPEQEHAALVATITPQLAEFEALRRQTLATIDRRAIWMVPLAGIGAFAALLAGGQGLVISALFGLMAALLGWFMAMGHRPARYQAAVKDGFGRLVTGQLLGLEHIVEPQTDLARLHQWQLFAELQSARTLDRIEGLREGRPVSLSEMSIAYAPGGSSRAAARSDMADKALSVSVVEVAWSVPGGEVLALTPRDAPARILDPRHGKIALPVVSTGDAAFDEAYVVRCNGSQVQRVLTPWLRASILALDRVAMAGRPYLSIQPGRLAVLFPSKFADLAFHVPPYWVPIDADALVAQFASDIALRHNLVKAVLDLPGE